MTVRKPTFLRWIGEAETNQVREWARLELGALNKAARPGEFTPRPHRPNSWPALLSRWRSMFGHRSSQITRDDEWQDSLS